MKKLSAAVLGGAVLATTLATALPASADTGHRVAPGSSFRSGSDVSSAAKMVRTGKIHYYKAKEIRGAKVWGHWYWARKGNGPAFVFLVTKVKDTRGDGKSAGFCYDLWGGKSHEPVRDMCYVNRLGAGKTRRIAGAIDGADHFRVYAAVGRLDTKKHIFYTSLNGPKLRVR
ncbi:hypothetical protein DZF91_04810 [Actinomadura logoneensis]|uniref:Uncharacterized protein n=1 Tax=Actinomadura logoneensis TaxID=2293572 RepID=A0A372JTP8_9ACTN|nr:hypothetical protein [Actinomadura logoneensis]RFU42738.1 hypothetical protein DZF91_04810 [Actinomadura logoneensis]